ncbi:tRNA(Met) cytidine acetyltransferase TmcA [Marinomonas transparens]|uniref:tRNA(Met) cytidine acetyltransferase TmcA n=1 Tax=Marinomonas transparens TaxID=2795388 RepID=A0A934JNI5_9GAMM|nr:GNAT family N-acetyltransferase [Marinomonas transparens]MBJ7537239.1 tRNA(Met) cytidine acetyltransferase [Marinomonas transparens]
MPTSAHHRHCFLLTGNVAQLLADFLLLSKQLNSPLIAAHDVSGYDALNTGDFSTRCFKQARQELGSNHDAILLDLTQGVSASALAILSGTVRAGGVFAIALPEDNWLSLPDQDLARHLPWPYEPEQLDSYFKQYLLNQLQSDTSPFIKLASNTIKTLPALASIKANAQLTQDQSLAQATLLQTKTKNHVLIAPRGRGKSTLLGDSLAKMLLAGKKVAVTAPNQEAIATLKARFEQVVAETDQTIKLPFFAPDALLLNDSQWDWLFVDEAAMIPVPLLMSLHQKANQCIFSTTDYGYEGAGKGFGIRFCRYLTDQEPRLTSLSLQAPIRWGENDPLENWINHCLCLTPHCLAEATTPPELQRQKPQAIEYQSMAGKEWLQQPALLNKTFQLLVGAHYQTSADNLRWILDDPSVLSYLSLQDGVLKSVAIMTTEGNLPSELSQAVLEGKRRPRGHLLPQSLLAHEGIKNAGGYQYWRISRIATEQSQQNKGLGSQLLNHIEIAAQGQCDFLCTSFAATSDVLGFWLKNAYLPVRLGTTKDQASGSYSLMMLKPLTAIAKQEAESWQRRFLEHFSINLLLQYQGLPIELVMQILQSSQAPTLATQLSQYDQEDLQLFIEHHRPFDSIRAVFLKTILNLASNAQLDPETPLDKLAIEAALGRNTEKTRQQAKLSGKKAMHQAFKALLKEQVFKEQVAKDKMGG